MNSVEHSDVKAAFPSRINTPRNRSFALLVFFFGTVSGGPAALFYSMGKAAGRGETYAEAYDKGRSEREEEMAKAIGAVVSMVPPIQVPDGEDDCVALSLLAMRAGALTGAQAIAFSAGITIELAP